MEFILASKSPRRAELLDMIGIEFVIKTSNIKEVINENEEPDINVMSLAFEKCIEIAVKNPSYTVISADTIVVCDGEILGKPKNDKHALEMLNKLNNKEHFVYSGFALINISKKIKVVDFEKTKIVFNNNTKEELKKYVDTFEPRDKAGAYGIQGKGALLIDYFEGDYFNVVGLPISKITKILKKDFQYSVL